MRKIHKRFLNKNSDTDVITFVDGPFIDIVISLDQAAKQAKPRGLTLYQEAALLICHGLLHAKGFDDRTPKAKTEMRKQEFEHLARVL